MGTEPHEFVRFIGRRGKGSDFTAPLIEKLNCEMSKTTCTNDPHAIGRSDMEFYNGTEYRNASTKERTSTSGGERVGQFDGPGPVGSDAVCKSTMTTNDGPLAGTAKIVIAAHTLRASHAALRKPTEADTVTDLEILDRGTNRFHVAYDLMTRNQRVGREAPLVAEHAQIRMANAAILHTNIDMLGRDGRKLVCERSEWRTRRSCGVGVNGGHDKKALLGKLADDSALTGRNKV
jgi:hypothetical protein